MYFIRNLVTKQFISGSVYGICFIMNILGIYDKKIKNKISKKKKKSGFVVTIG